MLPICVRPERVWPKLSSIQGITANLVYIVSLPPTIMEVSHSGLTPLFSVTLIQIVRFSSKIYICKDVPKPPHTKISSYQNLLIPNFPHTKIPHRKISSYQKLLIQNSPHTEIPRTKPPHNKTS